MSKKFKLPILLSGLWGIFSVANFALAADFGFNQISNTIILSAADPRMLVGRLIQIVLGFLGVIALGLIIYAGFLWMTSNGEEDKVRTAQQILKNAAIGLVIIFASWAITTFIFSKLYGATLGQNINQPGGNSGLSNPGLSAFGTCTIDNYYPTNGQNDVPRNTSIMVTFKETLQLDSVCVNGAGAACACDATCNKLNPLAIRIYKADFGDACSDSSCPEPNGNAADVVVTVPSGNKTLVLTPLSLLGSPTTNTEYTVKFTNRVKKADGTSMFKTCRTDYASWQFNVSSRLDLSPPIVAPAGIFPLPDNEKDVYRSVVPAGAATGGITINSCPKIYHPASIVSINPASAAVVLDYQGTLSGFKVAVPAENTNKAQLFDGQNNLLGIADFDANGLAAFPGYLTIKAASHPVGSLWDISITPEISPDTLTVGGMIYTFASTSNNNFIKVNAGACNIDSQANNIAAKLSGHPDINIDQSNNVISIVAKVAGQAGNNITLATSNASALALLPLSGGVDRQESTQAKDKKDSPMNSVIQINFNEALNPLTISGSASEVANYIRVVNAATSSAAEQTCNAPADCRSYKCEAGKCVGDYLAGKFMVSNNYRTVEFISDQECGMNGCGEKIYCLPANSHLVVEMAAANLKTCSSEADCLAFSPYKSCSPTALGYNTCQDPDSHNYPTANLSSLDGIVDAAINSFDGNRSTYSDGPLDYYNENYNTEINKKDKYKWSFYINDQIFVEPPQISFIEPSQGKTGVDLGQPIQVNFNTLMMNSTLVTGSTVINNGSSTYEHKRVNLRSVSPSALGYWIKNDNQDTAPLDGAPDLTVTTIYHSPFRESLTYRAQIGSGVKDIYQNCYKPSVGPNCSATAEQPSCCFGNPTGTLGADGNCQ